MQVATSPPRPPIGPESARARRQQLHRIIEPNATSTVKNPIRPCSVISGDFDLSFNNGKSDEAGTNGITHALALQGAGQKILVGGNFTELNKAGGFLNLGRLNANGVIDGTFSATANQPVRAMAVQSSDSKCVIAGDFTQVNGVTANHIARLEENGALDGSFAVGVGSGTDGPATALLLQSDGKVVLGGNFTTVNGITRGGLARLESNGALDGSFQPASVLRTGGSPEINSIVQQVQDGKLIIAGLFDAIGSMARRNVARLHTDGSVDMSFDPGAGPDDVVRSLALQPDGKPLLGGDFTTVDTLGRTAAARLFGDTLNPLQQWRLANFGTLDPNDPTAGDLAIPHGDGVTNLMKYALNLDPQRPDATPMSAAGTKGLPLVAADSTGNYLTLTHVRRISASSGISYNVKFAEQLGSQSAFASNPQATITTSPIDSAWERITVTDSIGFDDQPERFGRLTVTKP